MDGWVRAEDHQNSTTSSGIDAEPSQQSDSVTSQLKLEANSPYYPTIQSLLYTPPLTLSPNPNIHPYSGPGLLR